MSDDDEKGKEDDGDAEEEKERRAVDKFVRKEVGDDWDDEVKSRARFKALSGQRSDWEPLYLFWRDLMIKVARHLRIFIIRPSRVKRLWFRRAGGLSPLSLGRVLLEMHRAGDLLLLRSSSYSSSSKFPPNPNYISLSGFFRKALSYFTGAEAAVISDYDLDLPDDYYILKPLLEERSLQVVNALSENHWTSSCVVSMGNFQEVCSGSKEEAHVILKHLSEQGRASHLIINRPNDLPIEGVKICLASGGAVSNPSSTDYAALHLVWTAENLERQLYLIDQRYSKSRNSALASLKRGNKSVALKYVKEQKLASLSRERCTSLLDRVEKALQLIIDAESSKKVLDAITKSTHAIRDTQVSLEDVELYLREVDENMDSLKQVDFLLGSNTSSTEIRDGDLEDEFNQMQLEIKGETNKVPTKSVLDSSAVEEDTDSLSNLLSNLSINNSEAISSIGEHHVRQNGTKLISKEAGFEAS